MPLCDACGASISYTVDVEKELKDNTLNRLNNEGSTKEEKPCIKFSEAVKDIYGPYMKNKVVIQHIEKLMSQTKEAEGIIPELNDPCVKKMLAAAKIQEENFEDGNNFILILCGFFLKGIQSLKTSGISCTDIHSGYSKALIEALRVLDKLKVNLKEINVEGESRKETGIKIPENSKIEENQDRLLYCEMDSTEKIKINRKNELLIKRKKGKKYYNTKITFDWKDSSGTSSNKSSCDGFFEVDDMILLLEYRLKFFSNRKMKIGSGPVNIVLYSSDINCSSVYEENDCILHSVLTKMSFINWYICANIFEFHANVIVAVGQIDKIAVSEINREGLLVVTLENHFELQRLQKAVGGNLIPDFTIYL